MVDGHGWVSALPESLGRHQRALRELLDFCEAEPIVTSLSVGCSLGRGVADELSDVDAAVGVNADRGALGAPRVRRVENSVVDHLRGSGLVDVLREEASTGEFFIRRVFAQLRDGVQLDLAVIAEAEVRRGTAAPDFVPLYGTEDSGARSTLPSAFEVADDQVRVWAFMGWRGLLDADKYLRRGSRWEAHQRLHEVRQHIWALWATTVGASYPWHGLSQVLDHDPSFLPAGIEATVAGLDPDELRSAVLSSASVLDAVSAAAARPRATVLPTELADYARTVLSWADRAHDASEWRSSARGSGSDGRSGQHP